MIGTGGHGHTFPGATLPFGACQVSPDTRLEGWDGCSGYHYNDSIIYGFSHTHLSGTGCSDYGDILLMPVTREMPLDNYQYASHFSHSNEKATAGHYQVYLEDSKVNAELTSTLHGALHQYHFPVGSEMYVVLDLKHRDEVLDCKMEKVDDYTIRGYRVSKAWAKKQQVFFEITFSRPIAGIIYDAEQKGSNTTFIQTDKSKHCIIHFEKPTKYESSSFPALLAKVAISGVDEEGAHKNLEAELTDWEFEKYVKLARQAWNKELSKIIIRETEDRMLSTNRARQKQIDNQKVIFYTALYHCMIHPSLYSDVDGRYRGRDDKIHSTEGRFDYYTVFSLWDTYRGLHPLLSIIDTKRTGDFINTFIKQYEQSGRLPVWELSSNETNCMIGYHVVSVIWDAYNKGIRNFDAEKAYEAMTHIATRYDDYEGEGLEMKLKDHAREGAADADALESYCKYGYVRSDDSHESVSKTLEYAYDDWCIARMAKALGKQKDAEYYTERSHNWMNVFDPETGFMRARKNGCLYIPFSPYTVDNNYTEANSWQYSFNVPHHIQQMIAAQGGAAGFEKKLDDLFSAFEKTAGREQADITGLIGQYAHGNEPSHHIAYLYNHCQAPQKKERIIFSIIDSLYRNEPDGLSGNEDCGQMSAWFVLSSIGLYPDCPGDENMFINNPWFDVVKVSNEKSQHFWVVRKAPAMNRPQKIHFTWDQIENDTLSSDMKILIAGDATAEEAQNENVAASPTAPYVVSDATRSFKDSALIGFNSYEMLHNYQIIGTTQTDRQYKIYYSFEKDRHKKVYEKPFYIYNDETIYFYAENSSGTSGMQTASYSKISGQRKIILHNEYNPSYSAGGADALMDGIYGKLNWRAGDWQGYQGQDVEVIMAFEQAKEISSIAANFLEDQNSWIFYPSVVSFYVSDDSVHWNLVESISTHKSDHAEQTSISKFQTTNNTQIPNSKYVKMIAQNFGPMPQWHEGRGNPTFIFIDELEVE